MTKSSFVALLAAGIALGGSGAGAQMSLPSMSSALPNVSKMSAGNAAGVLQYCMKNNLVSSTSAGAVVDQLGKKQKLTPSSADFSAGQAGKVMTGPGKSTSLSGLQPHLKSQACGMVLKQARNFL